MAKTEKRGRQGAGAKELPSGKAGKEVGKDAEALLRADHRKVAQLFRQFKREDEDEHRKSELARQACNELIIHSMVEEEIFYPACRQKHVQDDLLDEAQVEHDSLKLLIGEVIEQQPGSPFYDAKVAVLSEYVKHHVREEEKPFSGIFAKARKAGVDLREVGRRIHERKQALMAQAGSGRLDVPAPRAMQGQQGAFNRISEETNMARRFDKDRHDRPRPRDSEDERSWAQGRDPRERDEQGGRYAGGQGDSSQNRAMGESRDWYQPEPGRGSHGGGSRGEFTGGERHTGGGDHTGGRESSRGSRSGAPGEFGGSGTGSGGRGYSRGGSGSGHSDDNVGGRGGSEHDSRGPRGGGGHSGGSGSFERENADYARNMGYQDHGGMSGGRSARDDDYTSLGKRARFGDQGNDHSGGHSSEDDGNSNGGRGGSGGNRGGSRSGGGRSGSESARRDRD